MVLHEPLAHRLEADQRRGGDDAGLAHRAAEQLAHLARANHRLLRPAEDRADRRAEPLREAELHRVHRASQLDRVDPERGRGVEDPRAVEVHLHSAIVRERRRGAGLGGRDDGAAAVVVRVLEAQER